MANTTSRRGSEDPTPNPQQIPDVPLPTYAKVMGEAWIVEGMMQIQGTIGVESQCSAVKIQCR